MIEMIIRVSETSEGNPAIEMTAKAGQQCTNLEAAIAAAIRERVVSDMPLIAKALGAKRMIEFDQKPEQS